MAFKPNIHYNTPLFSTVDEVIFSIMPDPTSSLPSIRARVTLKVGKNSHIDAEMLSFRHLSDQLEHVALVFAQADQIQLTPLVRLHSECLTGDVFHSSRCDCGEQLDETIELMAREGGVILYLRQEGRGIGLYNKIDAYVLQSDGMNTYEANRHLGFEDDLRDFTCAIEMLKALQIQQIELITNNPKKMHFIEASPIKLAAVRGTQAHIKQGNKQYLQTKVDAGQHKLDIDSKS